MAANNQQQEPVILSHDPQGIRVDIQDPSKPKNPQKYIKKTAANPTIGATMKHAFFGPDVDNVGEYVLKEYLEPTGKRLLNNASQTILKKIGDGIQVLLFGKVISSQNGGVDYTSFYNPNVGTQQSGNTQPKIYKVMDAVDTFTFATRDLATETLNYLRGYSNQYGSVPVSEYYEHIGASMDYSMQSIMVDRGWIKGALNATEVKPTPEGFIIDLPRPILLKKG